MADETPPSPDRIPPEYRTRVIQGMAVWVLLALCVAGWIGVKAASAVGEFNARVPRAVAQVKLVYLTPQILATPDITFDHGADAGAAVASGKGAFVSVIITDLGLSQESTTRALEDMPAPVALAFSPYGALPIWLKKAQEEKHETLVLLPMEPDSYPRNDPGPKALLTRVTEADNASMLSAFLKESTGASGVMNFMGSQFLKDKKALTPVFVTLQKAGAIFIEDPRSKDSVAEATAKETGLPYLSADIDIDRLATETDVAQKLGELENLARERGYAVGVAAPYPVSFNLIKSWAASLEKRGVKLIPLSSMMKVQARSVSP